MKLKYYLRGVGVALIITATFLYILNSLDTSTTNKDEHTDDYIITKAKELGMDFANVESLPKKENQDLQIKKTSDVEELSNEEIIALAKALGMSFVMEETQLKTNDSEANENSIEKEQLEEIDTLVDSEEDDSQNFKESDSEYVKVIITYGMDSEKIAYQFKKAGIIEDSQDFNAYLIRNKYDKKLRTGTYRFIKGSSYEEILDKIVR